MTLLGWLGTILILVGYSGVVTGYLAYNSTFFRITAVVGPVFVGVSSAVAGLWNVVALQTVFALITVFAIVQDFFKPSPPTKMLDVSDQDLTKLQDGDPVNNLRERLYKYPGD